MNITAALQLWGCSRFNIQYYKYTRCPAAKGATKPESNGQSLTGSVQLTDNNCAQTANKKRAFQAQGDANICRITRNP